MAHEQSWEAVREESQFQHACHKHAHLKQRVGDVPLAVGRQSAVEFCIHALAAVLLLSAELLSTASAGDVKPVTEALPSTYLAMVQ